MNQEKKTADPVERIGGEEKLNGTSRVNTNTLASLNSIPEELKALPRWVTWKLVDGKKIPQARINDPATWTTYDKVKDTPISPKGGPGFVFQEGDTLGGCDLDSCRNPETGELTDWAKEIVDSFKTYTEVSPSGSGLKLWGFGAPPKISPNMVAMSGEPVKGKKPAIEAYVQGRFFCVTGQHLEGTPREVRNTPQAWLALVQRIQKGTNSKNPDQGGRNSTLTKMAGKLRRQGFEFETILAAIRVENQNLYLDNPLPDKEVVTIAKSVCRYAPKSKEDLPSDSILMEGGRVTEIVDQAEYALLKNKVPIYQRGGELVWPGHLDKNQSEREGRGIRRSAGSVVLHPVTNTWLQEQMGKVASWYTVREYKDGSKGFKISDPADKYASTLLHRKKWDFPVLRGVLCTPTLDPDGRIIESPGFDLESGLLLDFKGTQFPKIPERPSKDDAKAALEFFSKPYRAFPWANPAGKSVALSALLTAHIRANLRTSPLHAFDAPTAGTGKTILAESPGLLTTGTKPPSMSQGKTPEEDEKRLSTVLHAGDPVILVDNCERPLQGDFLCSMLTQETVQARILGLSERRILPCNSLVLATGNNLQFAGDISRRTVICRLDSKEEKPDEREFNFDVHKEILACRPEMVVAGLTILLAYHLAGRPENLKPMGSFEDWSWVRGALVWLGEADPAVTREAVQEGDVKKNELQTVMDAWETAFGDKAVEVCELNSVPEKLTYEEPGGEEQRKIELKQQLSAIAGQGRWNAKSVGWWLNRNKERIVGGRFFQRVPGNHVQWALRKGSQG